MPQKSEHPFRRQSTNRGAGDDGASSRRTGQGREQLRVPITRALAMAPNLLLADEPTGNLDTKSADNVFGLMREVHRESGASVLMVTHNLELAQRCDRIIDLVDGRLAH